MPAKRIPVRERFESKVVAEPACGCWLWTGYINPDGYGKLSIDGFNQGAHRASWILHCGEIPAGLMVLHKCDNAACVNPDHLYLGNFKDNVRDAVNRGRWIQSTGERNGNAVLSEGDVLEIRRRHHEDPELKFTETAKQFGVTAATIGAIVKGDRWKFLPMPGERPPDGRRRCGSRRDPRNGRFV